MDQSKSVVVSKFGGTSMGDASCILQSASLSVKKKTSLVVVSATSGTTNQLIELAQVSQRGDLEKAKSLFESIKLKHLKIATDLKIEGEFKLQLDQMLKELESISLGIFLLKDASPRALDAIVSFGERISSLLFVKAYEQASGGVKIHWLDVREYIKTDDQFGKARPLIEQTKMHCQKIRESILRGDIFVTQGFIGSTEDGVTTTLGRGGSDYSAALLAEALGAQTLEIWTDVPGIATTDPRICPRAQAISEISFTETSELATFGAKVLHPATLLPALRQGIPVFVGSTFSPDLAGTWVKQEVSDRPLVRAIATRKKQALLTLTTPEMLQAHGFLFQIFKVFNDNKVSIDAITTSEISVSMTVDDSTLHNKKLLQELSMFAELHVEEGLALVALIGNNINHTAGLAKKIFETIADINVRMICLGASRHNFCFVVQEDKANETVARLHHIFIEKSL